MTNLSWTVGDVKVTRIVENEVPIAPRALLPQATHRALARHLSWLKPWFMDDEGRFLLSFHSLIVESMGQRIVVDTCVGEHTVEGMRAFRGSKKFLKRLERAGFSLSSMDVVVSTHLHYDHVGWNTRKRGKEWVPTFENARYLIVEGELSYWRGHMNASFQHTYDSCVRPVLDEGLAHLVPTDYRITEEVSLEPTPGHTPGHVSVRISSRGETAFIPGDAAHHPVQWAEPDWKMTADCDCDQGEKTRRRLAKRFADGPTLIIGTHYAGPAAGHIRSHGKGFRFAAYQPEVAPPLAPALARPSPRKFPPRASSAS
jgi:glyoxylase-like metal-dependent hydrolase (beta-lactamase superfamily II)